MVTPQEKKKILIGAGAMAGLCILLAAIIGIRHGMAVSDIKRYAEARGWEVKEDSYTGNLLCGNNAKTEIETFETFTICGKTFRAQKSFGEKVVKANKVMEKEFAEFETAYAKYISRKDKAGFLEKRKMEAQFNWKWKAYRFRKELGEGTHDDPTAMQCIRVNWGFRSSVEQYRIFMNSLTDEGKELWKEGKPIGAKYQHYTAAPPCTSYHETGRAIDVDNWDAAGHYLWAQGMSGGSRGLYKDPFHFSIGELSNQGTGRATANRLWYVGRYFK